MKQYAVMVRFDVDPDDWIYVTEGSNSDLKPKLYDTQAEAEEAKQIWKNARVVEYES